MYTILCVEIISILFMRVYWCAGVRKEPTLRMNYMLTLFYVLE